MCAGRRGEGVVVRVTTRTHKPWPVSPAMGGSTSEVSSFSSRAGSRRPALAERRNGDVWWAPVERRAGELGGGATGLRPPARRARTDRRPRRAGPRLRARRGRRRRLKFPMRCGNDRAPPPAFPASGPRGVIASRRSPLATKARDECGKRGGRAVVAKRSFRSDQCKDDEALDDGYSYRLSRPLIGGAVGALRPPANKGRGRRPSGPVSTAARGRASKELGERLCRAIARRGSRRS